MLKKSTIRIIQLFSFVMVTFSTHSLFVQERGLYAGFGRFIHSGFIRPKFFTPFEIIFIVLLFNILNNYKVRLKFNSGLLLFAFIAYFIRMINPNAETSISILGMSLLTDLDEYIFLFMIVVLISIPPYLCKLLIEKIFKYVLIFSIIKAIIIVIMYFSGAINVFRFDYAVMLPEPDTQFLFAFLGAAVFTLYLLTRENRFLLFSVLFFAIVTFSMQRITTLTGLIAIFLLMMFAFFKVLPMSARKSVMIIGLLLVFFQISLTQFADTKIAFTINRYMGVVKEKDKTTDVAFSDTGHREQSITVFLSVVKDKPFWGIGYGRTKDRLYLKGQTSNIHNTYATLWAQHGIVTLLFFLFIFVLIMKHCLKLMYKINKYNYREYIIYLLVGFYLFAYFVAAWVNSGNVFMYFRFQVFWFLMFIYLTRCSGLNYNEFKYEKSKRFTRTFLQ